MTPLTQMISGTLFCTLVPALVWAQSPPLKLYASAYGFATQLEGGKVTVPLTYHLDVPFSDSLDTIDIAHAVYVDASKGRWGAYLDTQYIRARTSEQVFDIPVQIKAKVDKTSVGAYVTALHMGTDPSRPMFALQPTIGLHFNRVGVDLKAEFMGQTLTASRQASWREPYIGARFFYQHGPRWALLGQANVGTRHTKEYQAYALYRTTLFKKDVNLRVGYRMLDQKHVRGDFTWDVKEQGPTLGFSMRLL